MGRTVEVCWSGTNESVWEMSWSCNFNWRGARGHTMDLSYTEQSWGMGGGCTFNLGSHTVVFERLYSLGMPNLCMDAELDGEWEVVQCTMESRNGWSKSMG